MSRKKVIVDSLTINRLIGKIDSGHDIFYGYEEEKKILSSVLLKTFKSGDSGSVIIFGPHGSGKSRLLEATLSDLKIGASSRRHYTIRLDGLIHTTDLLALSVIGKTLGIELSTASQIGAALQEKISTAKTKRPFLFILDNIDVFCRRQQILLYTLFDAIHNVDGLCLVGLTTKTDCTDYLEKRVRSRILYKTIVITSPFQSFKEYLAYAMDYLENSVDPNLLKFFAQRQYAKSKTPEGMKKFLLNLLLNYDSLTRNYDLLNCDHKIERLCSLTYLELAIVCLMAKRLTQTRKQIFRPLEILPLLNDIPSQITKSKGLFLYSLNRLIDYGLVTINSNQRSNSYMSDWSSMSLNVEMEQIKKVLELKKGDLPTGFTRVLETSC